MKEIIKIQRWWIKKLSFIKLLNIKNNISLYNLQDLSNKYNTIIHLYKNNINLSSVILINILSVNFFQENNINICNIIFNNINDKSSLTLIWSKKIIDFINDYILIINIDNKEWWKKTSRKKIIPRGIYIINIENYNYFKNIENNNKTNTLIKSYYLYLILMKCIKMNLFIYLPEPNKILNFNLINAFSE